MLPRSSTQPGQLAAGHRLAVGHLPAGIYLVRLQSGGQQAIGKVLLR